MMKMCGDMKKAVDCFGELDSPCGEVSERHAAQAQQGVQTLRQMYDITCATLGPKNEGGYQESEDHLLERSKRSSESAVWVSCKRCSRCPDDTLYQYRPLKCWGSWFWRECYCEKKFYHDLFGNKK